MDPKRVEDLVYVHINLRLLSRKEDGYKKGQSRMWDIGGDAYEPLDGVGIDDIYMLEMIKELTPRFVVQKRKGTNMEKRG
ncbi:hypothetical protein MTR_2g090465 [Medicago truncatula]|uniref:Uncharacterized protein n=1 Tax=Medicago truncatula TaxID=3880 RepID=A0A072VBH1_MEDTR|nr:hypothetical protein MTR_2g090465 [Medicago truncatula]